MMLYVQNILCWNIMNKNIDEIQEMLPRIKNVIPVRANRPTLGRL